MPALLHPISRTEYSRRQDGKVIVRDKNGVEGLFDNNGNWISGERRTADAALCRWVADGYVGGGGLKGGDAYKIGKTLSEDAR
jgi:hypothetical protein